MPQCAHWWLPTRRYSSPHTPTGAAIVALQTWNSHESCWTCNAMESARAPGSRSQPAPGAEGAKHAAGCLSYMLHPAHRRSAVDNILMRLRASGLPALRLGRPEAVAPQLRACLPGGALWPGTSVAQLRGLARSARVVSQCSKTTCPPVGASRFWWDIPGVMQQVQVHLEGASHCVACSCICHQTVVSCQP